MRLEAPPRDRHYTNCAPQALLQFTKEPSAPPTHPKPLQPHPEASPSRVGRARASPSPTHPTHRAIEREAPTMTTAANSLVLCLAAVLLLAAGGERERKRVQLYSMHGAPLSFCVFGARTHGQITAHWELEVPPKPCAHPLTAATPPQPPPPPPPPPPPRQKHTQAPARRPTAGARPTAARPRSTPCATSRPVRPCFGEDFMTRAPSPVARPQPPSKKTKTNKQPRRL